MMRFKLWAAGAAFWSCVATAASAATPLYDLRFLDSVSDDYSVAHKINNLGEVVGYSRAANGHNHATHWSSTGVARDLSGADADFYSQALDINDSGQIVGLQSLPFSLEGMLWSGDTAQVLGGLGGRSTIAYAINASGLAGGESALITSASRAVLWDGGPSPEPLSHALGVYNRVRDIDDSGVAVGEAGGSQQFATVWSGGTVQALTNLSGAFGSSARSINESGQIVGVTYGTGYTTMFATVWSGGSVTALSSLGGQRSTAHDINEGGAIVGNSALASGASRATLWLDGEAFDLNGLLSSTTDFTLEDALGINARGQIVGYARNASGTVRAFVLTEATASTTVPEPGTWALMIAGFGMAGAGLRRRRRAFA